MKTSQVRDFLFRGMFFSASLLVLFALGRSSLAVETSGYAFGWDSLNSYDYQPHSNSGLDSAISSSFTPFAAPTGHAQSWASAKLIGGVLTKTTGGYGWVDGTNPFEYFVWSAFASGTKLIVTGAPTGTLIDFTLVLPASTTNPDDLRPGFPLAPRPGVIDNPPSQLFFTNSMDRDAEFFEVKVSLDARVVQKGTRDDIDLALFNGDAILERNGLQVQTNGDFGQVGFDNDPGGLPGFSLATEFRTETFQVEANVPFDLMMDLRMSMGDPDALIDTPKDFAAEDVFDTFPNLRDINFDQLAFGGGSFVVRLEMDPINNPAGLTLSEVPEPGSFGLALAGLIALAGCTWRRRRSR